MNQYFYLRIQPLSYFKQKYEVDEVYFTKDVIDYIWMVNL